MYQQLFGPFFNPYTASLAFAIMLVAAWMAVLWWMYDKRIIVKIRANNLFMKTFRKI